MTREKTKWRIVFLVAPAIGLLAPAGAIGGLVLITDPSEVPGAFVQDFNAQPLGAVGPNDFDQGGASTGFVIVDVNGLLMSQFGVNNVVMDIAGTIGSFEIIFNTPMSAVGVDLDYLSGPDVFFEAYDAGGTMIGSTSQGPTGSNPSGDGFFGLKETTGAPVIHRIIIHDSVAGFTIDNFTFGPVPAPGAAMLGVIGIAVLVTVRRRLG